MSSKLSDYDLKSKTRSRIVEKINTKSQFFYSAKISRDNAQRIANSNKLKVFGKGNVEVSAISLFYEPYILAEGKADLDYIRKKDYEFYVDETVHSISVGNIIIKPVKADVGRKIKIPGVERINLTRGAKWFFNPMGGAQSLDFLPSAGKSKVTSSWLNQHKKELVDPSITLNEIAKTLKNSLMAKPTDSDRILSINSKIDLTTFYMPAYYITYKKGEQTRAARIDAIIGKINY